ncbi:F-box domain-containing protein [Colletotrichum sojae]|uniref:F-box domain-containing protein n=1 Tax=Colletotrichum sojae TaxID=2175907 RepID=A0A8H6J9G3_9PEZI|nr:F-box domain-containing protein [Colletotrichum sojae]
MDVNNLPPKVHSLILCHLSDGDDFNSWNRNLDTSAIRNAVQRVVIESSPSEGGRRYEEGYYPRFYHAIDRIGELSNLNGVHVLFGTKCQGRNPLNDGNDDFEPIETRLGTLNAVLKAISERAAAGGDDVAKVRTLTLEYLQNLAVDGLWTSDVAKDVIKDIIQLHLYVVEEWREHGPDHDAYCEERWRFEPHLQTEILPQFAANLTILTLGFEEYWGTMPGYFDGCGLVFPCLRTLNLIQFVISHHDHFDWVLAQTSLQTLGLGRCHIASHISCTKDIAEEWGVRTHDWEQLPHGAYGFERDDDQVFIFSGTWGAVFDRIREGLTNLVDFRFAYSDDDSTFNSPHEIGTNLFRNRYIVFWEDICPSPWMEARSSDGDVEFGNCDPTPVPSDGEEDPDVIVNRGKEVEEEDDRAFQALLGAVRVRAQA